MSSSVFFRAGGAFFMINEFLVWARHTRFIGLPFAKKKVLRYVLWAFSISFVDTQQ